MADEDTKLIIYRLDKVDETLQVIIVKLDEVNNINGKQNMAIAESKKDIDSIGDKIREHQNNAWKITGLTISIAGLFSGIVAWVIGYFRGIK